MVDKQLVPVFVPALAVILANAEDEKASPLSREEVLGIRDNAAVIMMKEADAEKMHESRGYRDIDPGNCWYDWQTLRIELGRRPDLDPGARLSLIKLDDKAIENAVAEARDTLDQFRGILTSGDRQGISALIKVKLTDSSYSAFMWLSVVSAMESGFNAALFEVPPDFKSYKVGDSFNINDDDILDWMVNDNGTLYGGYSLRVLRETMSDDEEVQFDDHIGVKKYA